MIDMIRLSIPYVQETGVYQVQNKYFLTQTTQTRRFIDETIFDAMDNTHYRMHCVE